MAKRAVYGARAGESKGMRRGMRQAAAQKAASGAPAPRAARKPARSRRVGRVECVCLRKGGSGVCCCREVGRSSLLPVQGGRRRGGQGEKLVL